MANSLISYDGPEVYLNNDNVAYPVVYMKSGSQLVLNSDCQNMFNNCTKIVSNISDMPFNYDLVTSMNHMYDNCYKLMGEPICGNNVTDMLSAYKMCSNLTGSPSCGPNVVNMYLAYNGCVNLTGSPQCSDSVKNLSYAYSGCVNLTGSPACGNNVLNMDWAYLMCNNLTGSPVCGPNVRLLNGAYSRCNNLDLSNVRILSPYVTNFSMCFNAKDDSKRLNIHVIAGSTSNTTLHSSNTSSSSIISKSFRWSTDSANSCYYNAAYNVYCYYDM